MVRITNSGKDTFNLGKTFSKILTETDVVILHGQLGAGKTTFVKGILEGLGVDSKKVVSPSFIIIREYKAKKINIYHIDLYRINKGKELVNLGYEDYFYSPRGISLVEWGEKIEHILDRFIKVEFSFLNLNQRRVKFSCKGYPQEKLRRANEFLRD